MTNYGLGNYETGCNYKITPLRMECWLQLSVWLNVYLDKILKICYNQIFGY